MTYSTEDPQIAFQRLLEAQAEGIKVTERRLVQQRTDLGDLIEVAERQGLVVPDSIRAAARPVTTTNSAVTTGLLWPEAPMTELVERVLGQTDRPLSPKEIADRLG